MEFIHWLGYQLYVRLLEVSKCSEFEPGPLGHCESIFVKAGGYNTFYLKVFQFNV